MNITGIIFLVYCVLAIFNVFSQSFLVNFFYNWSMAFSVDHSV